MGVSIDNLEPNGLIAVEGQWVVVENTKRYLLGSKFLFCFLDGQLQHLFAITLASQIVINNDESKSDNGFRYIWIAKHDMPHYFAIIADSSIWENSV